jgi:hypothetical protein
LLVYLVEEKKDIYIGVWGFTCEDSTIWCLCYKTNQLFTGLPCVYDLGGENPYIDTKDVLKASELWATRPSGCWSPLERAPRGEKLPKGYPTAEVLLKPKQQLYIQNGTRAHYLNYLQRGTVRRGRSASNGIG